MIDSKWRASSEKAEKELEKADFQPSGFLIHNPKYWRANVIRPQPHYSRLLAALRILAPEMKSAAGKKALEKNPLKGKKIVHFGSGPNAFTAFLEKKEGAEAFGLDVDRLFLKKAAEKKSKGVKADATRGLLPFKSESLDFVISEHFLLSLYPEIILPHPKTNEPLEYGIIRDCFRVLKPGGFLVMDNTYYRLPIELSGLFEPVFDAPGAAVSKGKLKILVYRKKAVEKKR